MLNRRKKIEEIKKSISNIHTEESYRFWKGYVVALHEWSVLTDFEYEELSGLIEDSFLEQP